ncbi:hypothetical protein L1049_013660 [Liquidambar formosana]|uniref:Pentatricopeptide repeat-containing protein n=1 Tax=Liquidambar formosana TaxID=63359 RepID=A0AAP0RQI7_LIQFO
MALVACSFIPRSASPDPRSWNKIIKEHVLNGDPRGAILAYINMQKFGFNADNFTFPILLKAVGSLSSCYDIGFALHGQTIKTGYDGHVFVQTALLNMYSSIRSIDNACKVFERVSVKDIVAWNSMLDAYASCGQMDNAIKLFNLMPCRDLASFNIVISGYASFGKIASARTIFDNISVRDIVSWNSMILAYTKAGDIEEARNLFEEMPERNVITWNTMITGYLHYQLYIEALDLFDEMKAENSKPDHLTVAGVLSACAHLGSLEMGRKIHIYAQNHRLASSIHVTTSLIDMYAKCGSIKSSLEVFYKSQVKDIYCWNAIISGLALHGYVTKLMSARDCDMSDGEFMMLANLYASCGQWEEAKKWRDLMNNAGIVKTAGCSVIEVDGRFYKFLAGEIGMETDLSRQHALAGSRVRTVAAVKETNKIDSMIVVWNGGVGGMF